MKKKISKTKTKLKVSKIKSKVSKQKSKKKVSKRNPVTEQYKQYGLGTTRSKTYPYPNLTGRITSLREAKSILEPYQWSIIKNDSDEYEVYPIGDRNSKLTHFSNDLTDAVMSGISQARRLTNNLLRRDQYNEGYWPSY